MAITLSGSTILVSSGIASGTATGGSTTTLTGSGFSSTWAGRIIFLTGGTGSGQSRAMKSATTNTITVHEAWTTTPDNTTTYIVSHDVGDIVGTNGAAYVGDSRGKTVRYDAGGITIQAGAVFGGLKSGLLLGASDAQLIVSGLLQFGHAVGSEGRDGGVISLQSHGNAYIDMAWAGRTRLYGCSMQAQQGGVAAGTNKLVRINQNVSTTEFTAISSTFTDVVIVQKDNTTLQKCRFVGERSGFFTGTPNAINQNSIVFSGVLSPRVDTGFETRGAVEFDVQYLGAAPSDPFFSTPVFLNAFSLPNGIHYYANTTFPTGYAAAFRWFSGGNGRIYEAYSVRPVVVDAAGAGVQDVLLSLLDASGSAGWWTSKDASFEPVKTATLTTNASGTIIGTIGQGEAGLVIRNRWTRTSEYVSGATNYGPFTLRVRKYGFNYIKKTSLDYTARTTETVAMVPNTLLTQTNPATVAAYTTLETPQKFYDYVQYWMSLAANVAVDLDLTRSGSLINAGALNVVIDATAASVFALAGNTLTIKASTYTGDMTTTGVITLANGATFVGTRTDANGTIAPPKTVSVTGLTAGSRLRIYNTTTATEVVNQIVAGTSYSATYNEGTGYTTGNTLTITTTWQSGTSAKLPFSTQSVVGSTGWSALVSQQNDTVYNSIAVDGSTVTEFAPDYTNVQVDISDPNGQTSVDRLYAWFVYITTTESGIRNWLGGIVAEDAANFRVVTATLNLKLDNVSATGVEFTGGHRLYRDDNATPLVSSTTGGGSITLFAGKVYTSVVSTASPVITGDISQVPAAVQTGMTAQGYTTARAAKLDNADVATSTRLASGSYTTPPSAATNATAVRAELTTELNRIDASVSSRSTFAGGVVASVTGSVGSVTAPVTVGTNNDKTGYALSNSAIAAIEAALINEGDGQQLIDAILQVINSNLDLPALELTAIANAVRSNLATELARIDVAISSRLASVGYTAPDNTSIAEVKLVTDKLDSALVLDGSVYQFTSNALENATGLDAVALRAAIGLASANLDTQLADLPTSGEIATGVWGALVADHTVNNSFGAKLLIASNPQRSVQVTGSNHVAADVHEFQPDVLTSNAIAASAITEIQSNLAIEATAQSIKVKTDNLPTDPADQSLLAAAIAAIPTYAAPDGKLVDTWRRLGLDPSNPLVNTATLISAGASLQIDVAQTCTSVTTTRQP
jgi:hypothetical protein